MHRHLILALALVAGLFAFSPRAAEAAPLPAAAAVAGAVDPGLTQVGYRHRGWGHRHGYYGHRHGWHHRGWGHRHRHFGPRRHFGHRHWGPRPGYGFYRY